MLDRLAALVAPLNTVLFTLWGDPVSLAELLGFVTGGLCVALTVRRSIANFPVGIANSAFFLVLFASARLWADSVELLDSIGKQGGGWLKSTARLQPNAQAHAQPNRAPAA